MKTLSICITTYNHEKYIEKTLDSILAQVVDFDYEIIIGDDSSTDNTKEILKTYQTNYPSLFKLRLNSKNIGYTANFDKTFQEAEGEFIAIFDGDDIMLPGKLQKQVVFLINNPSIGMVGHAVRRFDSNTNETLQILRAPFESKNYTTFDFLKYGNFIPNTSKMFRRCHYPKKGLDHNIKIIADWLLSIELSFVQPAAFINEVLSDYRSHNQSIMNTISIDIQVEDIYYLISKVETRYPGKFKNAYKSQIAYIFLVKGRSALFIMNRSEALKNFIKSIIADPFYYTSQYVYLAVAFLPIFMIRKFLNTRSYSA